MLLKRAVRNRQLKNQTVDFLFMNEPEKIDVIQEEKRRGTFR